MGSPLSIPDAFYDAPASAFVAPSEGGSSGAGDVARKRRAGLNALLVAGPAIAQAFDAYSTHASMQKGAAEANPLLEPFATNQPAMYVTKVGIGALEGFLADRLSRSGHPTAAKLISALDIGLPIAAGIHNMQLAGRR